MATNSSGIDAAWDEDTAQRRWAIKQDRSETKREAKNTKDQTTALQLTQSQLAKRPDLWYSMPVNHY